LYGLAGTAVTQKFGGPLTRAPEGPLLPSRMAFLKQALALVPENL